MNLEKTKETMFKQGYRFVGKHSAVKICEWCRESLREKGICYKQKFYGISSHRCVQMTPVLFNCTQNCLFCWRTMRFTLPGKINWEKPDSIINGCIKEQQKILKGFLGNPKTKKTKFYEAMHPNQFAISLAGEPCLYPYLPEMIDLLRKRDITSFIVTNGTLPEMIEKLIVKQPTQLYITLPAPSEDVYKKICNPLFKDGWERILKSLSMIRNFNRNVIRLTLVKDFNMFEPEKYSDIIEEAQPMFIECKAFMSVGGARKRIGIEKMPTHEQIKDFAGKIEENTSYKIVGDKKDSRVVLLSKTKNTKISEI